jgi:hypothetical protein
MSETQNDSIKQDPVYKIEDTVKGGWKRVRRFAKDHPTITASAVSAVVSWKLSKRHTIKKVAEELYDQTYNWGYVAGELQMQNAVLLDFINVNGLGDQVREFIREHVTVETA